MEQRSDEWFQARLGKVTASRIADVMATLKDGSPAATRKNYAAQIVCERLTGTRADSFSNAAMQWGTDTEPQARAVYSMIRGCTVEEIGFVDHPVLRMSGASPDGLIGADGMVEIKCPNTATHIETLLGGGIDDKYMKQMHFQMMCAGRQWCDFVSFDPRLPDEMQIVIQRVDLVSALAAEITEAVATFLDEIDDTIGQLKSKYQEAA